MSNLRKGFRPEKAQMIALAAGRRLPLAQVRTLAVNAHNAASYKEAEDYYRAILRAFLSVGPGAIPAALSSAAATA